MARKSKKNSGSGIEILLAIPIAIFMFLKEHMWLTFLIAAVIIAVIIGVRISKKKKREAFLRWYYDRERRIAEINLPNLIDQSLTDAIMSAASTGTSVTLGRIDKDFENICECHKLCEASSDIFIPADSNKADTVSKAAFANFGIKTDCKPMAIRFADENDGGYVFYAFPETVLAFVEGPEQVVFLAAYHPSALKITCTSLHYRRKTTVMEKSQNPIRYYDKFNPVRDAEIISSKWEYENNSGNRNLRFNVENNPLHFTLRYGKVVYKFAGFSAARAYSRFKPSNLLATAYTAYSTGKRAEPVASETVKAKAPEDTERQEKLRDLTSVLNKKAEDNVFTSTTTTKTTQSVSTPQVETPNIFLATDTTTKAVEPAVIEAPTPTKAEEPIKETPVVSVPKKPISVDDARYRNRMVAHPISQRLNAAYMDAYEFKIYQVRKPRSDWGMQDAGIYTYINVDGVRYTVEFNIRTIPEDGTTQLEFFVWADTIVSVQRAFQSVIDRENMQIKATGFSVLYDKDYQNLTNEQMIAELEPVIKALFASLAEKATATDVVEKTEAQYCSQCGKPLVPGHAFCGKCGTPVKK